MYETFETPRYLRGQIEISYVPYTAEWQVSRKSIHLTNHDLKIPGSLL